MLHIQQKRLKIRFLKTLELCHLNKGIFTKSEKASEAHRIWIHFHFENARGLDNFLRDMTSDTLGKLCKNTGGHDLCILI